MPDRSRSNDRVATTPHSTFFSKQQMGMQRIFVVEFILLIAHQAIIFMI
jgi:hypothetical protein